MKTRLIVSFIILVFIKINLVAQNNKKSVKQKSSENQSYLLSDVSYINDAVFMGRRDSIAAPYIFPSIGYYDKSGFFVDGSASYLVGSEENRVDLFLISAGYIFTSNEFSGGISGTKYFFNDDSYNVRSEIVGDITGMVSYDFQVAEVTLMASTYLNNGDSADIFAGFILDHTFNSSDNSFLLSPTVSLYAGSQYFYQEYYSTSRLGNRKGQGKGSGSSSLSAPVMVEIEEVSKFNILNVELSLPLQYYHDQFIFSFNPILALPQTSSTIITEETTITEDLESVFYFSIGISYWFNTKKVN
ncbi:hypothetical protein GGR42_003040 [Saonia flava]|uniref:Uncharacterized protein n=1 Tax=Saonia flava TaxID=523696 RepID=A0A846R705_9FLAO|nr:hypothetical protein [Saonia flava]NJB72549.1 hypothetical protein [Saonia flava]